MNVPTRFPVDPVEIAVRICTLAPVSEREAMQLARSGVRIGRMDGAWLAFMPVGTRLLRPGGEAA